MIGTKNLENKTIKAKKKPKRTCTFHQHNIIILTLGSDLEPGAELGYMAAVYTVIDVVTRKNQNVILRINRMSLIGHQYLYTVLGRCQR